MAVDSSSAKHSGQGACFIWQGMRLREIYRLLRQRPGVHWCQWRRLSLWGSMGAYNSLMSSLEDLAYAKKIEQTKIEHPPIFLLGFWRSGTTLLHNLVTKDPQFTFPNLYQVMFPWHFLLTEQLGKKLTGWMVPKSRPMDNIPTFWDMPQEDEMALCIMSLISSYSFLAFQNNLSKTERFNTLNDLNVQERKLWERSMMLLMKKLTILQNKPIVMKSPGHTFRIPHLLKLFPDAKFMYIRRNPYDVYRSAVHLRRVMLEENALGRPAYTNMPNVLLDWYEECFRAYESSKHLIPAGRLHELRYEDLEVDPVGQLEQAYRKLGLSNFEQLQTILEPELPELKNYKKNKFQQDTAEMQMVYDRLREAFVRYGYPPPSKSHQNGPSAVAS